PSSVAHDEKLWRRFAPVADASHQEHAIVTSRYAIYPQALIEHPPVDAHGFVISKVQKLERAPQGRARAGLVVEPGVRLPTHLALAIVRRRRRRPSVIDAEQALRLGLVGQQRAGNVD